MGRTLHRYIARRNEGGEKLPAPFESWDRDGIHFRRGNLHMIAGLAGAGKTALAVTIVLNLRLPTLYVCADTDEGTIFSRQLQRKYRKTSIELEPFVENRGEAAAAALADLGWITWTYDSMPTPMKIEQEIQGYHEKWGEYPALVVVDNLMDVEQQGDNEFGNLRDTVAWLKWMAREYNTAVLALNHITEGTQGSPVPPRSSLWGKVAQLPALILNVAYDPATGIMWVGPVKNRWGWSDPTGRRAIPLKANLAHMVVEDLMEQGRIL